MKYPTEKTEEDWKKQLDPERYKILRQKGTEYPHTGKYNLLFDKGTYCCGGCGETLFRSESKFDGHCGWPSFDEAIPEKVSYITDVTLGMKRTEILCANCGGHLGHVFEDGPTKTGQRYCVNSLSVDFKEI
jgi:peptide-methionine (R)-S-oxide reductase